MRILAVDYGDARTGLAVCDSQETLATPIPHIAEKSIKKAAQAVVDAVGEKKAELVVIGLPINMDGSEGPRAEKCRKFGSIISAMLGADISVEYWDERVSTMEAYRNLHDADVFGRKQRELIDSESARIILESFLTYRRNS